MTTNDYGAQGVIYSSCFIDQHLLDFGGPFEATTSAGGDFGTAGTAFASADSATGELKALSTTNGGNISTDVEIWGTLSFSQIPCPDGSCLYDSTFHLDSFLNGSLTLGAQDFGFTYAELLVEVAMFDNAQGQALMPMVSEALCELRDFPPGGLVNTNQTIPCSETASLDVPLDPNFTYTVITALGVSALGTATADFSHTGKIVLTPPAGYTIDAGTEGFLSESIPEPASLLLCGAGLIALGLARRIRR
jgi:hypothetical protein